MRTAMKCLCVLTLHAGVLLTSLAAADAETSAPATYYVDGPGGDGFAEGGSDRRDHGIYTGTDNNIIDGCEFSHNRGFGIHIYTQAPESADNNVIRNCYSHHNGIAGATIGVGAGNIAYNNILVYNNVGIVVRGTNTRIYHNTIYGNKEGMNISNTTNAQVKNNIIYQSSAITGRFKRGGAPTNTGLVLSNNLIDVEPLFVDATSGDFRLKAGSPAIDAGVALKEVPADRNSTPRPQGRACDIGAYEFRGATVEAVSAQPK